MKIIPKLVIAILIFSHYQYLDNITSSKVLHNNLMVDEYINPGLQETAQKESSHNVISYDWVFKLNNDGVADVRLDIGLNWIDKSTYLNLTTPRTMQYRSADESVRIDPIEIDFKSNTRIWGIYPDLSNNKIDHIILEFYWPLAASFFRDRWYISAFEDLQLFPRDYDHTIKNVSAVITLPIDPLKDSISVNLTNHQGFTNVTKGNTVTLNVDSPQSTNNTIPPITYTRSYMPIGLDIETMVNDFIVHIPSYFSPYITIINSRVEKVSNFLRNWLNQPEHKPRIPIIYAPRNWDVFIERDARGLFANRTIFLQSRDIFGLIDTYPNLGTTQNEGFETFIHEMTHSYTPIRSFPWFFKEGLAQLGEHYCLMALGYSNHADSIVNITYLNSIDVQLWNWEWDNEYKGQLYRPALYILYDLINSTDKLLFQRFFDELEKKHICFNIYTHYDDKWRLFIYYLGKAADRDLFTYFQQWGLQLDSAEFKFNQVTIWIVLIFGIIFIMYSLWNKRIHLWTKKKWLCVIGGYIIYVKWLYYSFKVSLLITSVILIIIPFYLGYSFPLLKNDLDNNT